MKFVATLMLVLALGLAAYGQEFGNDAVDVASTEAEDFMENLLNGDDDEIVDMDDALNKYRMLKEISMIVAKGEAMDLMNPKKRFIGDFFNKVKEAIKKAAHKVGDFFTKAWNKAKEAFSKVTKLVDFKSVVNKLLPYIHSGMSVAGCKKALAAAATAILGPAAGVVGSVSGPVCDAALAKLQDIAG